MAIDDSTKRMVELSRQLHQAAQDRKDDFLEAMTAGLVKSAERLLAREIDPTVIVRRPQIDGR